MNKHVFIAGALIVGLSSNAIFSQEKKKQKEIVETLDEVVVTATKFSLQKENTGKVIYKITQKQLQNNVGKSVVDVLNAIVGIEIKGNATNSSEPKSMYVRGGRSRQVLILIDGVPVSDPSGINQEYDLRFLSLDQIESIEVLKGASSTLYGSSAASGVINIQLKKATNQKLAATYQASIATNNNTSNGSPIASNKSQRIQLNGHIGKFNFLGSFNVSGVDGMSSAKATSKSVFEHDTYDSKNTLLKFGYEVTEKFKITSFFSVDDFEYDFDAGAFLDADTNIGNQQQTRIGIRPSIQHDAGELYMLASINTTKRAFKQLNTFSMALDEYRYQGISYNLDVVHKLLFSDYDFQLITGVNYQEHYNKTVTPFGSIDENMANFNTFDPYASLVCILENGLSINVGGRLNMHNVYGNRFVYDGNAAYNVFEDKKHKLKLFTSYSTAFIAPSLYQLYDGFSGNILLKPETNKTIELGFDYRLEKILSLEFVYFNRKEKDAIVYDSTTFTYANGNSDATGFELSSEIRPINSLLFRVAYTHVQKNDFEDFNDYIPQNKFVAGIDVEIINNTYINLQYRNTGERSIFDRYGSFGDSGKDVVLDRYQVFDMSANYELLDEKVTFFTNISNIFNEDYIDVLGYNTLGRNYQLGVRLKF